MIVRIVAILVLLTGIVLHPLAHAQESKPDALSFEDWRSLSQEARREVFALFSPAKRAQVVSAHLKAWRAEHHARLSAVQLELIEEAMAIVQPATYESGNPVRQDFRGFEKDFLARAKLAFLEQEIAELFYLQFEPKPRKK